MLVYVIVEQLAAGEPIVHVRRTKEEATNLLEAYSFATRDGDVETYAQGDAVAQLYEVQMP